MRELELPKRNEREQLLETAPLLELAATLRTNLVMDGAGSQPSDETEADLCFLS